MMNHGYSTMFSRRSNDELKQEIKIVFVLGDPRLGPDAGRHRGIVAYGIDTD